MDLYENKLLNRFTECTITENKCYPPLPPDIRYPAFRPSDRSSLWQTDLLLEDESPLPLEKLLRGRWYVEAGLNPAFDCFDCQSHNFYPPTTTPAATTVTSNIGDSKTIIADATFSYRIRLDDAERDGNTFAWRTKTGDKRLTLESATTVGTADDSALPRRLRFDPAKRWGIESFVSDSTEVSSSDQKERDVVVTSKPRRLVLTLRPNMMNYRDEWVILAAQPDRFFIVAYSGTNAAWQGYGGMNVYTRSGALDVDLLPAIEKGLNKVGLALKDFNVIDNSCQS